MRAGMSERIAMGVMLAALAYATASSVRAQTAFPNRPITMVVPFPAGGTADLLCRFAAEKASGTLGQQIVIENRAGGAGGRVGTESELRSPADGYTVLCASQLTYSITHLVFTKAAFDTRAMEMVSVLATYPLIVLARSGFVAYAQANPGKVNYGHQGKGNTGRCHRAGVCHARPARPHPRVGRRADRQHTG
jgi:tripartite-type tricarboxylate transporter receptor subunit TctC